VLTAHKAKGLEFSRVKLAQDFDYDLVTETGEGYLSEESANLLYVACTRAQDALDISLVRPLTDLFRP
jgi:superfamily I DNA/RNA helicase